MPLGSNTLKTAKVRYQGPTQPVASTRLSSTYFRCNLRNGATCTTRRRVSVSLQVRLASTWSKPLDLDACLTLISLRRFYDATDKSKLTWFWSLNQETITVILRHKSPNRSCWFWGPNQETRRHQFWGQTGRNRRPWFWGQTKKHGLIVSSCMVQTAHNITQPLDRPSTEYLSCVWPSPVLYTRSPTYATILVATRHAAPVTCTPRDKQMRFSTRTTRVKPSKLPRFEFKPR
jgi:hypothetical protein